ncbi:MAG: YbaN family protein [Xanthomonadales bacterium]|nr:YbaN family protein [Xanthomonadales bacterium]
MQECLEEPSVEAIDTVWFGAVMRAGMTRLLWRLLALLLLAIGAVGILVPGLPTVVFWLMAAWAASRGAPELEQWLLEHPRHGAAIRGWREAGRVPRPAKRAATLMMLLSLSLLALIGEPGWRLAALAGVMAAVLFWLWRRPE